MADAVVEDGDVWSGVDVTVEDVLRALTRLRRQGGHSPVRTNVLTLVVLLAADADPDEVFGIVHGLGGRHPSRTILVRLLDGEPRIDARVGVHDLQRQGARLALDDVLVDVVGPAGSHFDSIVDPLVLHQIPVVLWLRDALIPADDARLRPVTQVIVDSARVGGAAALPAVSSLAQRLPVNDLAWVRLLPLREQLAWLLQAPAYRPFLDHVTGAEARGNGLRQALLGGWLDDRLGQRSRRVADGGRTAVVLEAADDGRRARFEASSDGTELRVVAEIDDEVVHDVALPCPAADDATTLGRALLHLRHDRVYEAAVRSA